MKLLHLYHDIMNLYGDYANVSALKRILEQSGGSTPGCTAEACSLRDEMSTLAAAGFSVVGVSADSAASHKRFIEKQQLNFPLIADSEKSLIQAIGAWGEKKMAGRKYMGILRTTIITDENGCVEHIITKVNTKEAAKQILELFK